MKNGMVRLVLGSGLLRRGGDVLLVRCRYEGEPQALWTLPGGRQLPGETLSNTIEREFLEETSLAVTSAEFAYVSESVDPKLDLHVLNCTFWVREADPTNQPRPADAKVLEAQFVPVVQAPELLGADVLRIPVAAALSGTAHARYFSFHSDHVEVPFFGRANG